MSRVNLCRPIVIQNVNSENQFTPGEVIYPEHLGLTNVCFDEATGKIDYSQFADERLIGKDVILITNDVPRLVCNKGYTVENGLGTWHIDDIPTNRIKTPSICITKEVATEVLLMHIRLLHNDDKFKTNLLQITNDILAGKISVIYPSLEADANLSGEFIDRLEELIPDFFCYMEGWK